MTIIIILLCLGLNAFTPVGKWTRQYGWLSQYFKYHQKWLGTTPFGKGVLGLLMALVPAVLAVAILQWILSHFTWGIAAFIFDAAILLYALGVMPRVEKGSSTKAPKTRTVEEAARGQSEAVIATETDNVLWQAQTSMFAVLFWFVILGPAGAVLYRFSRLLSEQTYVEDSPQIRTTAMSWVSYLDWLPVRLLGLCFVLAGRFESAFKVWWGQIGTGPQNNIAYLEACSHAALEHSNDNPQMQWALYQRALIILLVILALIAVAAQMHS